MPTSDDRVLVVDDDEMIRHLITINLQLEGFEVFTAVDGLDCLERVREVRPTIITLDVMMPRLDGWGTATRLRADPETAPVKIIFVSSCAQQSDLRRGARVGADAFLTKPFDPEELIATVRRLAAAPAGSRSGA